MDLNNFVFYGVNYNCPHCNKHFKNKYDISRHKRNSCRNLATSVYSINKEREAMERQQNHSTASLKRPIELVDNSSSSMSSAPVFSAQVLPDDKNDQREKVLRDAIMLLEHNANINKHLVTSFSSKETRDASAVEFFQSKERYLIN